MAVWEGAWVWVRGRWRYGGALPPRRVMRRASLAASEALRSVVPRDRAAGDMPVHWSQLSAEDSERAGGGLDSAGGGAARPQWPARRASASSREGCGWCPRETAMPRGGREGRGGYRSRREVPLWFPEALLLRLSCCPNQASWQQGWLARMGGILVGISSVSRPLASLDELKAAALSRLVSTWPSRATCGTPRSAGAPGTEGIGRKFRVDSQVAVDGYYSPLYAPGDLGEGRPP